MQPNTPDKSSLGSDAGSSEFQPGGPSAALGRSGAKTQSLNASKNEVADLAEGSKSKEIFRTKEYDFKRKHIGIIGVLLWIFLLHVGGIYLFTKGFLLTRLVLSDKSSCTVSPLDEVSIGSGTAYEGCWYPKTFDKAVFLIIDALRYDFTVPFHPKSEGDKAQTFHDNIPILYDTAVQSPDKAFLLPFIADPPTTTLQRLKGLTTGTLPTFIDAGSNFAGTAIDEDNIVSQLRAAGKNLVHLGDDTWHSLFPGYFDPELTRPFDSFNVWDLHTVDNGVNEHLFPLLHSRNATKWDVIFGHYLGVDHAGHRYGPDHASMAEKLKQMDRVIREIIKSIDDETLLIVMGDHGMDSKGDHGGESDDELEAALWMYSKKGIFGRTSPDAVLPPRTAKERPIPQIDIVPTLSLLLGIPIPFNNLGSPIEEAFTGRSGSDLKSLATVNRITSAQIKRYQHQYAMAQGTDDSKTSGPLSLWTAAESQWKALSKLGSNTEKLMSAYLAYREYQRDTLNVCRSLWARFDVSSMIRGIALLVGGIAVLITYARGLREDRTAVNSTLLFRIGLGSSLGAAGALVFVYAADTALLDSLVFSTAVGSILGAVSMMLSTPKSFKSSLPNSSWSWFAVIATVSQSVGFASNSYTIWEDQILLFFLVTFGVLAGISSMRQISTTDRVLGTYHSILFIIMARLASFSRLCREEQMPYCESTYYSSATSSTSAPWQLIVPVAVAIILPTVVKSFFVGTKSYEGSATLWVGIAFRLGLILSAVFWTFHAADDSDWFPLARGILRYLRNIIAQLVLAIAFAAGTATFVWAKPCISINVTQAGDQPEPQQQRTTITILGFANVHGSRFVLLLVNFCLAVTLLSKPMGQGAIAIEMVQILSLIEILDTNALTTTNSAIGPVVLGLLGSFHYFKTGHQATLNSIQWESAFFALSTIRYPWSPLLVIFNTFGAQILAAVAVPLVVLWKRPIDTHGRVPVQLVASDEGSSETSSRPMLRLLSDVAQASATHILYYATINLATTMWAGHLRRHLMLYRIFNPRFMLGAAVLGVVDLAVIFIAVGLGVRWNTISVAEVFGW